MSSPDDLKNYLRTALNDDGFLNEVKADILKKIFEKIKSQLPEIKTSPASDIHSNVKLIINELILEYLNFESLSFSESVFRTESGHGNVHSLPRRFLCQALQIKPTVNIKSLTTQNPSSESNATKSPNELIEQPIPLLYYIVHYLMVNGLDKTHNHKSDYNAISQESRSINSRLMNNYSTTASNNDLGKMTSTAPLSFNQNFSSSSSSPPPLTAHHHYHPVSSQEKHIHFDPEHVSIYEDPCVNHASNCTNSESDLY
nr:unnamed protein product [Trichobilharzia regenti]